MDASAACGVTLDTSPDRVKSPLKVDMPRVGTLRPRSTKEIRSSNWTIGCETLDRDFAKFDEYKEFLPPLGCKTIRLQCGWHKCEKVRGVYDFAWLDESVDFALANGMSVIMETSYGNRLYPGGGGEDLSGGFPTSEEALAAWDRWVDALTRHFKGRVRDFKVWNEPGRVPLDGCGAQGSGVGRSSDGGGLRFCERESSQVPQRDVSRKRPRLRFAVLHNRAERA